ncbi:hypothetical protein [uncultured Desulfobulbus sp.]|uniref:hypothetical protein n=1 Tax=uncultured Desulfobulbus sp. TaxID=239745 RepID=UPI0029C92E6A|nr:hypothetical protein [uncultured Desulfobulbus sp.]
MFVFLKEGVAGEGSNLVKEVEGLILPVGYGTVNRCMVHDCIHGLLARSCEKRNNRPGKWCQPALVWAQEAGAKTAGFYWIFLLY